MCQFKLDVCGVVCMKSHVIPVQACMTETCEPLSVIYMAKRNNS